MAKRDIIGIGGSSGSTEVLKAILAGLPKDLDASIFITTHVAAGRRHYLADVLGRTCELPVQMAGEGEAPAPGHVYIAPPDVHLLVINRRFKLGKGPRENMVRPSIDPMLRSLALSYGSRVIGVIVTGSLNDGASGLSAVKQRGGLAVVQSPGEAVVPDMPRAAIDAVEPDHIAAASAIGPLLAALAATEASPGSPCPGDVRLDVEIAAGGPLGSERLRNIADAVPLSCPHCQGVLSELRESRPLRYRCQTGHAVSGEILDDLQVQQTEEALRIALRVMEERAELVQRMGRDARRQGRSAVAELYEGRHTEYAAHAGPSARQCWQDCRWSLSRNNSWRGVGRAGAWCWQRPPEAARPEQRRTSLPRPGPPKPSPWSASAHRRPTSGPWNSCSSICTSSTTSPT